MTGDLGLIHLYAGNLEDAAAYCTRAVALEPSALWAVGCAFDALAQLESYAEARPLAARLVDAAAESAERVLGPDAVADDVAVRRFQEWRADRALISLANGAPAWTAALALAGAGRRPEAVTALRRAATERGLGYVTITIDPRFRPLWADPAFRSLANELALHGFAALRP